MYAGQLGVGTGAGCGAPSRRPPPGPGPPCADAIVEREMDGVRSAAATKRPGMKAPCRSLRWRPLTKLHRTRFRRQTTTAVASTKTFENAQRSNGAGEGRCLRSMPGFLLV